MPPKISLLYDSGAYSAYTQKSPIDLAKYADFLLANKQHIFSPVNLDVIDPEGSGEDAAAQGFKNFLYLKDRGIKSMPVYHSGEPIKYLDKMIAETDYIGLAVHDIGVVEMEKWYNMIFDYVTDSNGYPVAKFHAFGETSPQALRNYPWFSADSTTWVLAAGMAGRIFIGDSPVQFRSKTAKDSKVIRESDTGTQRETWCAEFRRAGLDPELCIKEKMREADIMLIRTWMNAFHFLEVQEQTRGVDAYTGPKSILSTKQYSSGIQMVDPLKLFFVFTSSTANRALAVLTLLGVENLLLSHFYNAPKQWVDTVIPYLYDPVGVIQSNPKIWKEVEFLQKFLLKPTNFSELKARYENP